MRIYGQPNKRSITGKNNLIPYFWETRKKQYIWTDDGVKQIEQNKMYNVMIKDAPVVKTLIGVYTVTVELHPTHYVEDLTQLVYRLTPTSEVECIMEYNENQLKDVYLQLPLNNLDSIHSPMIKSDILKFFTLL
jgi:hypothetical protein